MSNKLILIVEDNPRNLKLFRDILQVKGYETLEVMEGSKVVDLAKHNRPDLILMDIHLPGMDGLSVTKILKSDLQTKNIPIVALTAYAMRDDEQKILEAGCDGYIAKPIDTRKFPEAVAGYLKKFNK